jgi:mycothiol synthase
MADVSFRPVRHDDVAAVGALVRKAEAHDGVPRVLDDEELSQDLAAGHVDPALDTRCAVRDGAIVGWALVWNPPAQQRRDRAELSGEVAPEHRGTGIGRTLLGWSMARARDRFAAQGHGLPCELRVEAYDWLEGRHRLYRRMGFEAARWTEELLRPLHDLPPVPSLDGVALVAWPDEPAGLDDEIRTARNAAFADHWGSTVVEPDQWHDFMRGHGARPDLSVIAVDEGSGEVVGLCANHAYPEDEKVTGRRDAWIANVATVRAARGRGVASAMLAWSLAAFAEAGFSHAVLDVDSDNPTGAARLYRNLGFEPLHRSTTFTIDATPR